ncbi:MAG TPA: transposase [Candidatus Binataceae bacterium]|nr:transposase [Candidatus Binataceae bacterium]
MDHENGVRSGSGKRVYRTVAEKRRIVELTLQSGASVAKVAQAEGVNAHQVFDWRRAYLSGRLEPKGRKSAALLPVVLSPADASAVTVDAAVAEKISIKPMAAMPGGAIHIELSGRVKIRVESGVDAALLRTVLESLRS